MEVCQRWLATVSLRRSAIFPSAGTFAPPYFRSFEFSRSDPALCGPRLALFGDILRGIALIGGRSTLAHQESADVLFAFSAANDRASVTIRRQMLEAQLRARDEMGERVRRRTTAHPGLAVQKAGLTAFGRVDSFDP